MLDEDCRRVCSANSNLLVPWWLMAAYAYDVEHDPIVSDACFDWMTQQLIELMPTIRHQHADLITDGNLLAGTSVGIQYPSRVPGAVMSARKFYSK